MCGWVDIPNVRAHRLGKWDISYVLALVKPYNNIRLSFETHERGRASFTTYPRNSIYVLSKLFPIMFNILYQLKLVLHANNSPYFHRAKQRLTRWCARAHLASCCRVYRRKREIYIGISVYTRMRVCFVCGILPPLDRVPLFRYPRPVRWMDSVCVCVCAMLIVSG